MAAKLDALDTEYGDIELADIQGWYIAELSAIPEYPSVIILGDMTDVEGEGGGWMQGEHTLIIACLVTDQDTEVLRRRLYRYIRAIVELLIAARTSIGYVITFERLNFSPMYGSAGTFISDARVTARLKKYETN